MLLPNLKFVIKIKPGLISCYLLPVMSFGSESENYVVVLIIFETCLFTGIYVCVHHNA